MPPLLASGLLTIPPPIDLAAVLVGGLSGSLLAARKRFDLVGVATLAIVAGLGGGIIRDVLLAQGPPAALRDSRYLIVALVAALVGFYKSADIARIGRLLTVVDAANLGIYTVVGALKALYAGVAPMPAAFLGIVTAVGGGVLRDVLAGDTPGLFHTGELYAIVSALGSALFVALWESGLVSSTLAGVAAIAVMFVLRLLAVRYGWTAPRPRGGRGAATGIALLAGLGPGAAEAHAQERPVVLLAVERIGSVDSALVDPFLVIRGNRLYGPRDSLTRTDVLLAHQLASPGLASMKSDLRNLVTAEEAYFADSIKYTTSLGTSYTVSTGVVGPTIATTPDGWTAWVGHTLTTKTCAVYTGSTSLAQAVKEGSPQCN